MEVVGAADMDGKPKGEQREICEWSRWEPCDIDPRLQAEPVGIGESINFDGDDVGVERWPRANSGCQLYGGRHRDFDCV